MAGALDIWELMNYSGFVNSPVRQLTGSATGQVVSSIHKFV